MQFCHIWQLIRCCFIAAGANGKVRSSQGNCVLCRVCGLSLPFFNFHLAPSAEPPGWKYRRPSLFLPVSLSSIFTHSSFLESVFLCFQISDLYHRYQPVGFCLFQSPIYIQI
ncbi:hypothetical protein BZA70DRAFT_272091 [Myxozyma melibiosi]|uniref:Secreted protein n=1 Tax=Myxozyma melibiosi TaxID=54550 RepID=A0ABR1FD29_9ASCO